MQNSIHTDPLFKPNGILNLLDLYEHQVILFVFDQLSNNLPDSFLNTFIFNHNMPSLRLTKQSDLLQMARCQSQFTSILLLYTFSLMWNRWTDLVF